MVADEAISVPWQAEDFQEERIPPVTVAPTSRMIWRMKTEDLALVDAHNRSWSLIQDSDDRLLWFDEFGTDWITEGIRRPLSREVY